jgi:hypothetical protein
VTDTRHIIHEIAHDFPELMLHGGFRARCLCGWSSDCYAQWSDARRAGEVHERRASRLDFEELIDRSSIGAAIRDIKKRGIDAHADDLAKRFWTGRPRRRIEAVTHVTSIEVRGYPSSRTRLVARCDCGWRGKPHIVNDVGGRAARREARKHREESQP